MRVRIVRMCVLKRRRQFCSRARRTRNAQRTGDQTLQAGYWMTYAHREVRRSISGRGRSNVEPGASKRDCGGFGTKPCPAHRGIGECSWRNTTMIISSRRSTQDRISIPLVQAYASETFPTSPHLLARKLTETVARMATRRRRTSPCWNPELRLRSESRDLRCRNK
jgi:hypothetical protein